MGPLARRSPGRLAHSGAWGLLVAGAFLLLTAAAASVPLFAEASGNAALAARLASVPSNASAGQAPVVRVVGGVGKPGQHGLAPGLDQIPGLSPGLATATPVGVELRPQEQLFTPFVAAVGREKSERARIFGDDDLAHSLIPVAGGSPRAGSVAGVPGVWLPAPVATSLRVSVGDRVRVGVGQRKRTTGADAVVAGIYAVGPDGRRPAEPPGSHLWSYRAAELPSDSEFRTLPALMLITDVASAGQLARVTGDDLLYAVEGQLRPATPTLTQAAATVAGIRQRQVEVRDPALTGESAGPLRQQVVSGLPTIVADATEVADRTVAWTTTLGAAGLALGLLAVLAVAVFGLARRSVELRHTVGLGIRASTVGALAAIEVLPVAVICSAAGLLIGGLVVGAVGPPGPITSMGLTEGAWRSALAAAVGVALIGATATLAAARAGQLTASRNAPSRPLPWEFLLLATAVTASAGLITRPADGGPPSPLDLLVPVLVLAATGAVGGRLALRGASTMRLQTRSWARLPALALAARRVAAGGRPAVLLVTVLTTGFGLLIYSLAAASSVRQITGDRAGVLAGARATTQVEAAWLLDDHPGQLPPAKATANGPIEPGLAPVPGARTPPLPAGITIVWRTRITVPPEYGNLDLLVIDPKRFAEVANWGTGPELAQARRLLQPLTDADVKAAAKLRAGQRAGPIPAIGVGDILQRPGDSAAISPVQGDEIPIKIMDVVPAFPGASGELPLVVVPADSYFSYLGEADPRVKPSPTSGRFNRGPVEYFPYLWSATNLAQLQSFLASRGLTPGESSTYAQAAQQPDLVAARRSTGYQAALGLCIAGLALIGLAMFAERAAARARAPDLMLIRMGMGRAGVRSARAGELGTLALLALLLAGVGVSLLVPFGARLLDPGGGNAPPFVLRIDRLSLAAAVAAVGVGLLLALAAARAPGATGSAERVLRDAE